MPPTNPRPCPTAADFTIPCPGCSGGARAVAYCAPGPQQYRQSASRGGPQLRRCGICKRGVVGALHRDHAAREALPPAQEW